MFDWSGVNPTGTFTVDSPYIWDLSKLYTTGEVTLADVPGGLHDGGWITSVAVPEPGAFLLFLPALTAIFAMHRAKLPRRRVLPLATGLFLTTIVTSAARA